MYNSIIMIYITLNIICLLTLASNKASSNEYVRTLTVLHHYADLGIFAIARRPREPSPAGVRCAATAIRWCNAMVALQ